ncbi:TetR/AcrR family transcriptional regulator [Georgenia sp. TF02-10]|uniref:TetR/AcrR family transcriptional regulator n=1 Tax=Georgenia sp. TF02-10 TaxID=2917725 RepID=UPI001FA7A840|nr:TetR/AcrR family transcriptional regulator [Georgenia sp. TF02-10]UNX55050.1 TetR/AcrR family transcriptional regulator [Georgenia sp. TF02-10]
MAADDVDLGDAEIPPRLRRLWGLDVPARKGPRPGLSREEIARAAIEIADAEGLAAVSMSRVAKALGYTTMSLYRYVESKDELVALMWDNGLDAPPEFDFSGGWRASLERWAFLQLRSLRAHPWSLDIPISAPPLSPRQIDWMEIGLKTLADTPLRSDEKLGVILAVNVAVLAEARLTRELAEGDEVSSQAYGELISRLVDRETHPHLRAAVDEGVFAFGTEDPDVDFAFSLGLTLDGIERMIESRS